MANHKSAIKRIRSSEVKKQRNRYQHKTARTAMKKFFEITKKKEAEKELPSLTSMIDKLAKNNIIHDNKAANLKANFAKHASGLKKSTRHYFQLSSRVFFIKYLENSNALFLLSGFPPKFTPLSTQNKNPIFCIIGDDIGKCK